LIGAAAAASKGQRWLPFAFLCVIAVLWATALAGPFQFDDYNVIVDFAPVHSLAAWRDSLPGIRPLLKLSYAINWTLSPSPFGFHLFNLLVHLLNGMLLLGWARCALPLRPLAALVLMALWLLHPVQTEAVTYIAGRSVSLSTTFLLAGLLVLAHSPRGAPAWLALCTAAALMVRETAWVFPLAFALVEFLRGAEWRALLRRVGPAALVVALAAIVFLLEPHYRHMVDTSFSLRDTAAQARLQVLAHGYLLAQWVSLAPNIDPDLRVPAAWSLRLALQGLALLSIVAVALDAMRRRSWVAAGVLWYFLLLLPTNSFMPRVDAASDRHLYAALVGPLWSLLLFLQHWRYRVPAAAAVILLLALATLVRNEDYRSELALWARTAAQSPHKARVWNNLGIACREAGKRECAVAAFQRAMALDPDDSRAAVNLYLLQRTIPVTGETSR
jgi:hypothetical protein